MMNLSIHIGSAKFNNPVTVASGTFGHAEKYYNLKEVKKLGAIVPKTVTLHPQAGNPPVRIVETPSGMINAIGIENPGADGFIAQKLPGFKKIGLPLIISILGHNDDQFKTLIEKFNACDGISAIDKWVRARRADPDHAARPGHIDPLAPSAERLDGPRRHS